MSYVVIAVIVIGILLLGYKMTSRSSYETADYNIELKEGSFELRNYPELDLVQTKMSSGNDRSFSRLL